MLRNLGTFLLVFVALIVVVALLISLRFLMLKFALTTKIYRMIEGKIFFNSVIRSMITGYLAMSISAFISI